MNGNPEAAVVQSGKAVELLAVADTDCDLSYVGYTSELQV
jgi:hypothetical protein